MDYTTIINYIEYIIHKIMYSLHKTYKGAKGSLSLFIKGKYRLLFSTVFWYNLERDTTKFEEDVG